MAEEHRQTVQIIEQLVQQSQLVNAHFRTAAQEASERQAWQEVIGAMVRAQVAFEELAKSCGGITTLIELLGNFALAEEESEDVEAT